MPPELVVDGDTYAGVVSCPCRSGCASHWRAPGLVSLRGELIGVHEKE